MVYFWVCLILLAFSNTDAACNFCSNCLKIILLFGLNFILQEIPALGPYSKLAGPTSLSDSNIVSIISGSLTLPNECPGILKLVYVFYFPPLLLNVGVLHVYDQTSNPNFKPTITVGAPLALTVMMGTCEFSYSAGAESKTNAFNIFDFIKQKTII